MFQSIVDGKGIHCLCVATFVSQSIVDEDMRLFFFMSTLVPVNVDMLMIPEHMAHLNTEVL
jgi:hypothetical protein